MIGAIIGDIVGSRFEFSNYRDIDFDLFTKDSRFTDDTVCTMAITDWIVNVDQWNPNDNVRFANRMADWCRRYRMGDYGSMFRKWISQPVPYTCINKELIRLGMAWHYKYFNKDPELDRLEKEARSAKRGLWSQANPTPPWDFRRKEKRMRIKLRNYYEGREEGHFSSIIDSAHLNY